MDSGASRHFTGYCKVFSNLVERETNLKILLGDNSSHDVKRFGSTSFHSNSSQTIHLHGVLYVSGLKKNLVSSSIMEDKGHKVTFIDGKVLV